MILTKQIAKHFREIHVGVNWTWSNLKDQLADVTWEEATTQIYDLNTIATLTYHINYYIGGVIPVFEGGALAIHDKFAFAAPPIESQEDWEKLYKKVLEDGEKLAGLIEALPESQLWENFTEEKYGNYYRNIHGIIEHSHYHLGQIVVIKKILRQRNEK